MVLSYTDNQGKHKTKWKATGLPVKGNKKAAQAMLNNWLNEISECDLEGADQLFFNYLNNWMRTAELELQPSTIKGYHGILKNHIQPFFASKKLKLTDVRIHHLEAFYTYLMREKALSPTSVRHCHRLISRVLNDAVRSQLIQTNPATLTRLPKQTTYEAKFLNYSQLQELNDLFKGHILQPLIQFIAVYGLRRGEALGLCWDAVDFQNDRFTISRTMLQVENGNYLKSSTKNASSYRTMPLTAPMRKLLLKLKEKREQYTPLFPDAYNNNDYVFVWEDGSPITPNYVTRTFHKILAASDLPTIRLHDLRHSAASNLLANGSTIVEVQHWLGHSQPSTTLNFYSHVDPQFRQRVSKRIEAALVFDDEEENF